MLPPIHQTTNGLAVGIQRDFSNDNNKQQGISAMPASPSRVGYPSHMTSASSELDRITTRLHALECENAHFREEMQTLRHCCSSNQQQHAHDKFAVTRIAEDLQRLAQSFNSKLQADVIHQQREQQKAALLFAEVTRLGHQVEGLQRELKNAVDETDRKFEAREQHAQFIASLSSKQQHQAVSPSRDTELHRQMKDVQDAMVQLRNDFDTDRSARWKSEAAIEAKLDSQLERLNTKLTTDKRDLARALDEQRQLVTGADLQRVTSHMREFAHVNDHLLALERWLHSEFGQIKRVFQSMAGDVDARFQCVVVELANGLRMWHSALTRQEDELGLRCQDLEDAMSAIAGVVQHKLRTLEEVIPLEVQARQKSDDKLRRRVEGVVKALSHASASFPQQTTLDRRVHQLEIAQRHSVDETNMQCIAMRETMQVFMEDSNTMLARLAADVEQERVKRKGLLVASREAMELPTHASEELRMEIKHVRQDLSALQAWTTRHAHDFLEYQRVLPSTVSTAVMRTCDDMRAETKRVKEEINALHSWTVMHAQECRHFFDFLSWSLNDVRHESAVMQCLDAVIDQIVETSACRDVKALANGINGALKQITWTAPVVTPIASSNAAAPDFEG